MPARNHAYTHTNIHIHTRTYLRTHTYKHTQTQYPFRRVLGNAKRLTYNSISFTGRQFVLEENTSDLLRRKSTGQRRRAWKG